MKKKRVEDQFIGTKGQVDLAAFHDLNLTKEKIREGLTRDLKMVLVFVSEVLHSKDSVDALAAVYWDRYEALRKKAREEKANAEPELDLYKQEKEGGSNG